MSNLKIFQSNMSQTAIIKGLSVLLRALEEGILSLEDLLVHSKIGNCSVEGNLV